MHLYNTQTYRHQIRHWLTIRIYLSGKEYVERDNLNLYILKLKGAKLTCSLIFKWEYFLKEIFVNVVMILFSIFIIV